ncbi:Alpha/Beta hydrolase protein [Phlyctochytrium arcticum]|nr:Alpha/Beta hydrolase protein [Phlyctochytrium arcticum]
MSATLKELSKAKCEGGWVIKYSHLSAELGCEMKFAIFTPKDLQDVKSQASSLPAVYFLSGLTCNEDNFLQKAGAQRKAAELGLFLIAPDTSPRGLDIDGENDSWDLGTGAGFYVDATEQKWQRYRMYSYVTEELFDLVRQNFPVDPQRVSIMGHSMGGHGALVLGLRNPEKYKSISAFAPIANPSSCPWGHKAFAEYLGKDNTTAWKRYDACEIIRQYGGRKQNLLVDQGGADQFLKDQLFVERLIDAAKDNDSIDVQLSIHDGYDHSYYFISTFVNKHLEFHNSQLHA